MPRISVRKLFLFGRYSLALLLPKKWLTELGVKAGAPVQLEFDRTRKRIVVRLNSGAVVTAPAKKAGGKKAKDGDWEPIPQI